MDVVHEVCTAFGARACAKENACLYLARAVPVDASDRGDRPVAVEATGRDDEGKITREVDRVDDGHRDGRDSTRDLRHWLTGPGGLERRCHNWTLSLEPSAPECNCA